MTAKTPEDESKFPLSRLLIRAVDKGHRRLEHVVLASKPFDSVENYGQLLKMQYVIHRDAKELYENPMLEELYPFLGSIWLFPTIAQDLKDLGIEAPGETPVDPLPVPASLPEALGIFYIIEASKLGTGGLTGRAGTLGLSETYGARHLHKGLAANDDHWPICKNRMNKAPLSQDERSSAVSSALQAMQFTVDLAEEYMG